MVQKKVAKKTSLPQKWHPGPVKGSFMVLSMVGFLISLYLVENINYKTAFMLVFIAMFIASVISMTHAPIMNEKEVN